MESIKRLRDYAQANWSPWFEARDHLIEMLDAVEREVAESCLPAPTDADGTPIHVGDVLDAPGDGNGPFEVRSMRLDEGGWELYDRFGDGYRPRETRHHKPTVEDVLREMLQAAGCKHHEDGSCETGLTHEQIAEYAARLRLAEEDQ